ncbi:alpha-mannosidase [Paenibacillus ferrarius]|uniref:Alpha-mannosidase n=1 Tax=Paenibacillus ferrarius TaxID=1469647 RepID=A0A1V4HHI9_9BACL|nr:alpha-mannosidase [Paenibacillus ferrarius]OPH55987.1 alpha-mannosidase [Paenibacillus ferrarius]
MATAKTTIHIIPHTHWDREWYMPFEAHHMRLIKTMDSILEIMEQDPDYHSFYLDGQTIILDDYLQIYPEKREKLIELCQQGKLSTGPWYVLQDEFLTSGEANLRNLQIGHRDAKAFGDVSKIGYFPDSFGNMGQAAQILHQAGITNAIFGRGVKATGFNNQVAEASELESPFSELQWESPDGSQVLGILFANWYNNGMEIPVDKENAQLFWEKAIPNALKYASTRHLLLMNGCDHQPPQSDLTEALKAARELYPEYEFIHSNLDDYVKAVQHELPDSLSSIKGELRGQRTDGWYTLVNTASARVYIKQMNQRNQILLEKIAEPLAALAQALGKPYPHAMFTYAWKLLMQNHPHDSICGCSVDEVYHEMKTRFDKSMQVADYIAKESTDYISRQVDTSKFRSISDNAVPFVVYNTSGYEGSGIVTIDLELSRQYFKTSKSPADAARLVEEGTEIGGRLVDPNGSDVAYTIEDLGPRFGYDLPDDKFRQPYMARVIRLTFEAANIPSMGYSAFAWIPQQVLSDTNTQPLQSMVKGPATLENGSLRVSIGFDGSLTIMDKRSGQTYTDMGHYEDVGDIGNEYIFKQPNGDTPITTKGLPAQIKVIEDNAYRATIEIIQTLQIPVGADEQLQKEIDTMVSFLHRQSRRSTALIPLTIVTRVSLERSATAIRMQASFHNLAKNHRLRVLFPSDAQSNVHFADSVFELAERSTQPSIEWQNPSNCQHQQAFVDVHDRTRGLTIANKGLNEYEILRDGRNTVAVTLLRAIGELGDWGVFPTPDAQCLGPSEIEWMIIPYGGEQERFHAYREAYGFQVPLTACQTKLQQGTLPQTHNFLAWTGSSLAFSNLKVEESHGNWVARWYNLIDTPVELEINTPLISSLYESNVLEVKSGNILGENGTGKTIVPGHKIFTVGWDTPLNH